MPKCHILYLPNGDYCREPATIYYGEHNFCVKHANRDVMALRDAAKTLIKDCDAGGICELCAYPISAHHERCTCVALNNAVAALEPRDFEVEA